MFPTGATTGTEDEPVGRGPLPFFPERLRGSTTAVTAATKSMREMRICFLLNFARPAFFTPSVMGGTYPSIGALPKTPAPLAGRGPAGALFKDAP